MENLNNLKAQEPSVERGQQVETTLREKLAIGARETYKQYVDNSMIPAHRFDKWDDLDRTSRKYWQDQYIRQQSELNIDKHAKHLYAMEACNTADGSKWPDWEQMSPNDKSKWITKAQKDYEWECQK